jgi:hypothetical protein
MKFVLKIATFGKLQTVSGNPTALTAIGTMTDRR